MDSLFQAMPGPWHLKESISTHIEFILALWMEMSISLAVEKYKAGCPGSLSPHTKERNAGVWIPQQPQIEGGSVSFPVLYLPSALARTLFSSDSVGQVQGLGYRGGKRQRSWFLSSSFLRGTVDLCHVALGDFASSDCPVTCPPLPYLRSCSPET